MNYEDFSNSEYDDLTFAECVVEYITDLLMNGKCRLKDIPKPIRIGSKRRIYNAALKFCYHISDANGYAEALFIYIKDMENNESEYDYILFCFDVAKEIKGNEPYIEDVIKSIPTALWERIRRTRDYKNAVIRTEVADRVFTKTSE